LKVLGHSWLSSAECVDEFVDASIAIGEFCDDLQPARMSQCFQ